MFGNKYSEAILAAFLVAVIAIFTIVAGFALTNDPEIKIWIYLGALVAQAIVTIVWVGKVWPTENRNWFWVGLLWPFQIGYERAGLGNQPWAVYVLGGFLLIPASQIVGAMLVGAPMPTNLELASMAGLGAVGYAFGYGLVCYGIGYIFGGKRQRKLAEAAKIYKKADDEF